MNINKLQELYPQIAKEIPAVQKALNDEIIGFYTTKIEKEGKREKLIQWFEYLSRKNSLQAVIAVKKLRRVTPEEKEKLVSIILNKFEDYVENVGKWQNLMFVLLELNYFDKAKNLYEYIKYLSSDEIKLLNTDKMLKNFVAKRKKYESIFSKANYSDNTLEQLEENTEESSYSYKFNTVLDKLMNYFIEQEKVLLESGLDVEKINNVLKKHFEENEQMSEVIRYIQKSIIRQIEKYVPQKYNYIMEEVNAYLLNLKEIYNTKIQDMLSYIVSNNDKVDRFEIIYEIENVNQKILKILNEENVSEDVLEQRRGIVKAYNDLIYKMYSIVFRYRSINTKILEDWLAFCDKYIEEASTSMTSGNMRKDTKF